MPQQIGDFFCRFNQPILQPYCSFHPCLYHGRRNCVTSSLNEEFIWQLLQQGKRKEPGDMESCVNRPAAGCRHHSESLESQRNSSLQGESPHEHHFRTEEWVHALFSRNDTENLFDSQTPAMNGYPDFMTPDKAWPMYRQSEQEEMLSVYLTNVYLKVDSHNTFSSHVHVSQQSPNCCSQKVASYRPHCD